MPMRFVMAVFADLRRVRSRTNHDWRLLQAVPAKPGLVGQVITGKYPHLATVVAGTAAVSNVVPSAAAGSARVTERTA